MLAVSWRLERPPLVLSWLAAEVISTALAALPENMARATILVGPAGPTGVGTPGPAGPAGDIGTDPGEIWTLMFNNGLI